MAGKEQHAKLPDQALRVRQEVVREVCVPGQGAEQEVAYGDESQVQWWELVCRV